MGSGCSHLSLAFAQFVDNTKYLGRTAAAGSGNLGEEKRLCLEQGWLDSIACSVSSCRSLRVCVGIGELLALGRFAASTTILGFLSVFFILATSLILNDYFDIESDKINAPERPLPAGLVTRHDVVFI
jgi:hypothetical protein